MKIAPVSLGLRPRAGSRTRFVTAARTNNFELRMRQAELEQQGFKVSLAQKDAYPSFTVGPYFSQERAGDREQQIGIGISMPLPLWNRNEGNIETATARQKQAETSHVRHAAEHRAASRREGADCIRRNSPRWPSGGRNPWLNFAKRRNWPTATTGSARCRSQLTSSCRSNISKRSRRCSTPGARRSKPAQQLELLTGLNVNAAHDQHLRNLEAQQS